MLLDVVWATIPDSAILIGQGQDSRGVGNGSEAFQHLELSRGELLFYRALNKNALVSNTGGSNPALRAMLFDVQMISENVFVALITIFFQCSCSVRIALCQVMTNQGECRARQLLAEGVLCFK